MFFIYLNKMARFKGEGRILTSVTISREFFDLAKEHNIGFTESLRIGIAMALAEKGVTEYDNKLNLHRKMISFREKLELSMKEIEELKAKLEKQ